MARPLRRAPDRLARARPRLGDRGPQPTRASLIVHSGRLLGARGETALAAAGERILAVGSDAEIAELAAPGTVVVDAAGGLVAPGFNDAHLHLRTGARHLPNLDLSPLTSIEGIRREIQRFARANPEREWVIGRGWVYSVFPGGFPDRALLDQLVPDRPAAMEAYDLHSVWVNSAALARLGVTRETADPPGGWIVRDLGGEPTGILKETAMALVARARPAPSREQELELLGQAVDHALRHGLTSVQDAGAEPDEFVLFDALRERGRLRVRTRLALRIEPGQSIQALEKRLRDWEETTRPRSEDSWLRGGILKAFLDGVVESRTAAMLAPYEGAAATDLHPCGLSRWDPGEFAAAVRLAAERGWQVQAHAIGDRAVRTALDAFEAAARGPGPNERRHRVEHIETVAAADVPRFGRLGVVASMQPYHADPTPSALEVWKRQIGPERALRGWIWGSIRRAGGRLAFGSDWPVVSLDPRLGLNMAVNRTTPEGVPPGGWLAEERLQPEEAIAAYTEGSAFAEHAEREKGALHPGLLADLTVFDRDLLGRPSTEIMAASVKATIVGGVVAYGG